MRVKRYGTSRAGRYIPALDRPTATAGEAAMAKVKWSSPSLEHQQYGVPGRMSPPYPLAWLAAVMMMVASCCPAWAGPSIATVRNGGTSNQRASHSTLAAYKAGGR